MKNICIISRYKPCACQIQGLTDPSDSKTMEGVGLSLVLHPVIKHELASKVELYIKITKKRAEGLNDQTLSVLKLNLPSKRQLFGIPQFY